MSRLAPRDIAPFLAASTQTALAIGTYLVGKRVTAELPPLTAIAVRSIGSALLLFALLLVLPKPLFPPRRLMVPLVIYGFLVGPINQGAFLVGLSKTSPAHASLLFALTPVGVYLSGVMLGRERPSGRRMAGLVSAFAGVFVLLLGRGLAEASGTLVGDLYILLSLSAWVAVTVQTRPVADELGPLKASAWMLVFAGLWVLPFSPLMISVPALQTASPLTLAGLAYLIALSSVASYLLWTFALSRLEASRVAIFANLQPVGTALLAWAVLGEPLSWLLVVGGGLVLVGVRLVTAK